MTTKEKTAVSPPSREYAPGARLIFLFLFLALAIHGLLFLLFRPLPQSRPAEKSTSRTRTILLLEDAPDYEKKLKAYRLKYALRYLEPGTAILPDLQSGFSRVLLDGASGDLLPELAADPSGKAPSQTPAPFILPERSLGELSPGLSRRADKGSPRKLSDSAELLLPIWNLGKDRTIKSWLIPDKSAETLFRSSASLVKGPTILVVRKNEKGFPPDIRVSSSCHVPALDQLAVRQLALYLGRDPALAGETERLLCSVLWHLPELKELPEAKK